MILILVIFCVLNLPISLVNSQMYGGMDPYNTAALYGNGISGPSGIYGGGMGLYGNYNPYLYNSAASGMGYGSGYGSLSPYGANPLLYSQQASPMLGGLSGISDMNPYSIFGAGGMNAYNPYQQINSLSNYGLMRSPMLGGNRLNTPFFGVTTNNLGSTNPLSSSQYANQRPQIRNSFGAGSSREDELLAGSMTQNGKSANEGFIKSSRGCGGGFLMKRSCNELTDA